MRFAAALALPVFLAASALADCSCEAEPDWNDSPLFHPKPIKRVPKLEPTEQNIQQGVQQAVQGLTNQNVLPPALAQPIQQAISSAIEKSKQTQVAVVAESAGTTTTFTVTPTQTVMPTVVPTTSVNVNGSTVTDYVTNYVTQTITAMPPGATILSNQTLIALDNIQDAINDAIAAVNLSKTGLDEAAQGELSQCLTAVLENGGLPAGYSCISQSGSTSAGLKSTFNNILEQFLGILPAKLIDDIQDAVMPMLTGLLPSETTLLNNINSAISSVVASLSGNSVTALEMMQSCYSMAIKQNSNSSYLQCYMSQGGPFDTLQTGMNSVIQQFVGYLPGTVLESVQNLTASSLQAGAYGGLSSIGTNITQQLDNALSSVINSLSGNSVTLMQQLQQCANEFLISGNATAAQNCIVQNPANTASTMVDSVAQQYSGYLPSSFFSDLASIVSGMNDTKFSEAQLHTALDQAFNNANMGPAFTGCFLQVQDCLLAEIRSTGNYSSTCPGPVTGCELIGSQNSTGLANTTLSSAPLAEANSTTVLPAANVTESEVSSAATVLPSSTSDISSSAAPTTTDASSSVESAASSAVASASATPSSSATETKSSSSSESPVSKTSTSASSSSEPASSKETSSSSTSSSIGSTAVVEDASATAVPVVAPTQRLTRRETAKANMKRSHAKLRMMYENHYEKI